MNITYLPPDFVTGEKYLLVVIDIFTKFIWVKALEKRDAASVYTYLKDNFGDTGFEIWQSNNGGEFKNHQVKELIEEQFNSLQIHGASRKPSTQGGIERANQTLKSKIRSRLKDNGNWSSYLNEVLLNYNTSFHSSIGMTPWYAEYGREYETPAIVSNNTNQKLFLLMEARLKESHQQEDKEQIVTRIQTNLEKNAERMRNQQKNVKITEFNVGERVLIKLNKRKIKKGELLFPYEGVISKKTKHYRYKVVWKTQGPLKMDKPSTESKRWFTTRDLKKFQYLEEEEEPFQIFPEVPEIEKENEEKENEEEENEEESNNEKSENEESENEESENEESENEKSENKENENKENENEKKKLMKKKIKKIVKIKKVKIKRVKIKKVKMKKKEMITL